MSTIIVENANDKGAGSLRDALAQAENGDVIAFAPELANKTIKLTSGELSVKSDITIDGAKADNLTISGNDKSRVFFTAYGTDVTLKNLTLTDGYNTGKGGAVRVSSYSELTVDNVQFKNNVGGQGGAIHVGFRSDATVIDSTFDNNDGTITKNGFSAGAIANDNNGSLTVKGSKFTNNRGQTGGAIYTQLGPLTVENSVFLDNNSKDGAAGIFADGASIGGPRASASASGGTIKVSGSRFEGNEGTGAGGALFLYGYGKDKTIVENTQIIGNKANANYKGIAQGGGARLNGNVTVRNVTFANNTSEGQGGGLWLDGDTTSKNAVINLENVTFSGNEATTDKGLGGAIAINPSADAELNIKNSTFFKNYAQKNGGAFWVVGGQPVKLTNSIIANNTANDLSGTGQQTSFQLGDGGGNIEFPGPQNSKNSKVTANSLVADPKLGSLQNINGVLVHPLLAGSPAIDAGVSGAPGSDQRGFSRNGDPDIGAYEFSGTNKGTATLGGSSANDVLTGTANSDRILSSPGADKLTGGNGNDQFVYSNITHRGDTITDFQIGKDKIVLTELLDELLDKNYTGNAIADGYVKVTQGSSAKNFAVQIDADGPNDDSSFKSFLTVNTTNTGTLNSDSFVF
ncbi:choice-of-anchor Q domain-containing protein [aff. Roholtiella sp. LEGE 12411]|uniref:choice-of-anchor Q domain-containing protein n=1 Tax=aff. Roholtiella sp. LEGE 12411 TaxID=1828822 RepID=UPI00188190FE|nr:choice-of-anchor Q domain-containing protein [aff. Roholtiella sp. LEGE 12411]MBE9036817.1 type I secretion C-terminal target domain-containing protein [aff. Roholtiella sp. LEGE 12411]